MTPRSQSKAVRPASHLTKAQQLFLMQALTRATAAQRKSFLAANPDKLTKQQVRDALKNTRIMTQTLQSRNSTKKIILTHLRPAMYGATTRYIVRTKDAQNQKTAQTLRKQIKAL